MKDKIMTAITRMLDNPKSTDPYIIYDDYGCCNEIMKIVDEEIEELKEYISASDGHVIYLDIDKINLNNKIKKIREALKGGK